MNKKKYITHTWLKEEEEKRKQANEREKRGINKREEEDTTRSTKQKLMKEIRVQRFLMLPLKKSQIETFG